MKKVIAFLSVVVLYVVYKVIVKDKPLNNRVVMSEDVYGG